MTDCLKNLKMLALDASFNMYFHVLEREKQDVFNYLIILKRIATTRSRKDW